MGRLSYHFGTGRGPVHRHASRADLDLPGGSGTGPDAVRLDFDGDGRLDDALWDSDGDGAADRAVLDLDDDGRGERAFTDPSGRGVWGARADPPAAGPGTGPVAGARDLRWVDVRGREATTRAVLDSDGDGLADAARVDADHDRASAELACDTDGDGRAEQLLVDHDGDGRYEAAYASSTGGPAARWDVLLADTDADRVADAVVVEGAEGWVPP